MILVLQRVRNYSTIVASITTTILHYLTAYQIDPLAAMIFEKHTLCTLTTTSIATTTII